MALAKDAITMPVMENRMLFSCQKNIKMLTKSFHNLDTILDFFATIGVPVLALNLPKYSEVTLSTVFTWYFLTE